MASPDFIHVWARVYKDLFCRYQTMQGRYVARRAGWDTHGLPVEVQVEKQLAILGQKAIVEQVGVERVHAGCAANRPHLLGESSGSPSASGTGPTWSTRITNVPSGYVESVWWNLQQLFEHGLLYEDLKVIPYCPRCGTALSSHELGQPRSHRRMDESAYVRLRDHDANEHDLAGATHLAVWTTTLGRSLDVAVAVNPEIHLRARRRCRRRGRLVESVFGAGVTPSATFPGSALAGVHYERPFTDATLPEDVDACYVVLADS